MAEPADGDFSGARAMSAEKLIAIIDRLHAELREQLAVEGSCHVESAHRQDDVDHSIFRRSLAVECFTTAISRVL